MIYRAGDTHLIKKLEYLHRRVQELELSLQLYQEASVRKRDELESSHQHLQSLIDSIGDPILILDPKYRVVLANKRMRDAAGGVDPSGEDIHCYQLARMSKMPCKEEGEPCPARDILKTKLPVTMSRRHTDRRGNKIFFDIAVSPVLNRKGRVIHIIESFRDITERIELEEEVINSEMHYRHLMDKLTGISNRPHD